ncbi:DsbA family protein [Alkalibacterium olivapovliticus]|uniref:Putative DsbA family dithiol-disulfide isomerase n=1 Tax=Alkalibacterium olivapovliticus TaxID=99907 RepID=A0A2T0WBI7_9LACT|nr:DsbA family protein [Alkalibacterium olivapovliticus]PRY83986.1 putative DsbA family dithiol-disulfide isomerase [Alkalibacterium olivapovliticus]
MLLNEIIEVFLFVNPLGTTCFESEKLIESFSTERNEKVKVRFIPLLNIRSIGNMIKGETDGSLENRNQLYTDSYHASLAFQAASMQGKKKGRKFLMTLQQKVITEGRQVTNDLILHIADMINLDIEMFEEDLESDFTKKAFNKDQKLALDMNITESPSCVVFSNKDTKHGYRIDTSITKQLLHGLCNDQTSAINESAPNHLSLFQMV